MEGGTHCGLEGSTQIRSCPSSQRFIAVCACVLDESHVYAVATAVASSPITVGVVKLQRVTPPALLHVRYVLQVAVSQLELFLGVRPSSAQAAKAPELMVEVGRYMVGHLRRAQAEHRQV